MCQSSKHSPRNRHSCFLLITLKLCDLHLVSLIFNPSHGRTASSYSFKLVIVANFGDDLCLRGLTNGFNFALASSSLEDLTIYLGCPGSLFGSQRWEDTFHPHTFPLPKVASLWRVGTDNAHPVLRNPVDRRALCHCVLRASTLVRSDLTASTFDARLSRHLPIPVRPLQEGSVNNHQHSTGSSYSLSHTVLDDCPHHTLQSDHSIISEHIDDHASPQLLYVLSPSRAS